MLSHLLLLPCLHRAVVMLACAAVLQGWGAGTNTINTAVIGNLAAVTTYYYRYGSKVRHMPEPSSSLSTFRICDILYCDDAALCTHITAQPCL
jgi:hypothetical protein